MAIALCRAFNADKNRNLGSIDIIVSRHATLSGSCLATAEIER